MGLKQKQNESALVCAARKGNCDALRALLKQNWVWLRGLVHSIVLNADDTDDVLQDICVRLINNIASPSGTGAVPALAGDTGPEAGPAVPDAEG